MGPVEISANVGSQFEPVTKEKPERWCPIRGSSKFKAASLQLPKLRMHLCPRKVAKSALC